MTKYKKTRGRKPKSKRYGKVKKVFPQRKNLKTALVSQLPKTGGKPLRMHDFVVDQALDNSELTDNVTEVGVAAVIGVKIQDGEPENTLVIYQSTGIIIQGDGRDMRNGTRIKLRRLELLIEAYQESGINDTLAYPTQARVYVIRDKQNNNATATTAELLINKMFQGSENIMGQFMDFDERNRFSLVYTDTFTLGGTQGAVMDSADFCSITHKRCEIPLNQIITYDHKTSAGTTATIASDCLWTIIAFSPANDTFDQVIKCSNRIFYTEV